MQCRKCKATIQDGSKYCNECGMKQEKEPSSKKKRGNGQGCAIKRGRTWTAIWEKKTPIKEDGKLKRDREWKGGFPTKTEALAYAANHPSKQAKVPTVRFYWDVYKKTKYLKISKSKQCAYEIAWKRWSEIADFKISDVKVFHLQEEINAQATSHYTAKDMKDLMSSLYKLAMAEEQVKSNLALLVTLPELDEKEAKPFTEDELKKMWEAYGNGDRIIGCALVMVYTGMMPGELFNLKKDMIDWGKREIFGNALKTSTRKKTPIVYPDMLEPVLQDLISTSNSTIGYVVGMNRWTFYEEYHKSIVAAGIRDLPPYSCRHTTATALALGNIAPSVIQKVMRHAKFATTQRYIHPNMDDAHVAIGSLKR